MKVQKMKLAGYLCLVFSLILTIMVVFGLGPDDRVEATMSLIGTWLLTGSGLLGMNAGKRLGGAAVQNKASGK